MTTAVPAGRVASVLHVSVWTLPAVVTVGSICALGPPATDTVALAASYVQLTGRLSVTLTPYAVEPPWLVVVTFQMNGWPILAVVPLGVVLTVTTLGNAGVTLAWLVGPV